MTVEVKMPDFGGDAKEGTIVAWHKQPGEAVAAGELLVEVMTDKVNIEIESPAAGTLAEILRHPDEVVPVGEAIAQINDT
jgi:pyruvate/2-oxoglutarate dehydrogenase complex dihydrolipoamide acyltransferase (E2) component